MPLRKQQQYATLNEEHRHTNSFISSSLLPDSALAEELVDLYFRYIHVAFHCLFHRPTLRAAVRDGSVPKIIFLGVASLSARFSTHPKLAEFPARERGRPYAKEAERLLDLHDTSLTTIQACMLLGAAWVTEGEAATESIYFSIASRMAMLLDLPNAYAATRIEQEANIRAWWSLNMTDTWSSSCLGLPKAIPVNVDVPLPMDERKFNLLSPADPPELHELDRIPRRESGSGTGAAADDDIARSPTSFGNGSTLAQAVRINQLLWEIRSFNIRVVSGELAGDDIDTAVVTISTAIESWWSDLPAEMSNTQDNMTYWAEQGFGQSFVTLLMNYFHAGQLLHYQFLYQSQQYAAIEGCSSPDSLPPLPRQSSVSAFAATCYRYAEGVCDLIYRASKTPGAEPCYPLASHVLVIASTVQLYTLLFSPDEVAIARARTRLERNFEFLTAMEGYWPSLDASLAKFKDFHEACLRSKDSYFRLDQWMLRFMLDFARPLHGRQREDNLGEGRGDWSLSTFGFEEYNRHSP